MRGPFCVAIDFDGTVTDTDVIDAVLQAFASPAWRDVEALWERGAIGSRECLELQMDMVGQPLERLLRFVDGFSIDPTFGDFLRFLRGEKIPFAVVSDGFGIFIERLLQNAGLADVPILANGLIEEQGMLEMLFPHADPRCASANCKCRAVDALCGGRDLVVIGDGRSDFCLARKAVHVFSKRALTRFCREQGLPHTAFDRFSQIPDVMRELLIPSPRSIAVPAGKD